MKAKHLVIVPHTHWDREWYVPFESFRRRLVSMIDHMLKTLEDDPKFKYFELDGQMIALHDYLAIRPENEKRIRRMVERGRIIIGTWYVQPDEFLVTGESIIRNLRMGIRMAKEFGKPNMIGYMPDQFGHISQMPQILAGLGIRSAVIWRGVGESVDRTQFLWESPDGTQAFTIYLADSYGNGAYMSLKPVRLKKRLGKIIKRQEGYCDIDSVLVMNGLDHLGAQAGLPEQLEKATRGLDGVTFEMGNLGIFIKQARKQASELSVHEGEFRSTNRAPLLPGVTSARVSQKQRDFRNCGMLEKYVEPLCAWAALCGDERPHTNFIEHAWRLTLQNHPHDSICGCSVDAVHEEMETRFERVEQVAKMLCDDAFSFIGESVDSSWVDPNTPAMCVYNPTSATGQVVDIVADIEEPDFVNSLKDSQGKLIPLQKDVGERELFFGAQMPCEEIREQVAGMHGREFLGLYINSMVWQKDGSVLNLALIMAHAPMGKVDVDARTKELLDALSDPEIETVDVKGVSGAKTRLTFFADELPPAGLSVYSLTSESPEEKEEGLSVSEDTLENDFYRVSVNENGTLSIVDKESGMEFPDCLRFIDEGDRGDSYNFDNVPGGEIVESGAGASKVSIVESGPVRATLRLEARLDIPEKLASERDARSSTRIVTNVTTLVSLHKDIRRIDFRTTFYNQCEDHRLRVVFNAPFDASEVNVESAFDVVPRPTKVEAGDGHVEKPIGTSPQKTFSCIESGGTGMALFNRGVPEIEAIADRGGTVMALTLVRAVGWLSREDLVSRPLAAGPTLEAPGAQCKGPHEFEYAFTSYQGTYVAAGIINQAHAYAFPAAAVMTNWHKGKIKSGASLAATDNPHIVISAIEASRRKGAWTVRLYNASREMQETGLSVWTKGAKVYEVSLLERKRSKDLFRRKAGRVHLSFRPSEIKTLQVVPKQ
jgi:alpha-mannosidase